MRQVSGKRKIDCCIRKWYQRTKSTTIIIMSHRNKYYCTLCSAVFLCNYNQIYHSRY